MPTTSLVSIPNMSSKKNRQRGTAVQVRGLQKTQRVKLRRGVALSGCQSVSAWLSAKIRQLIREQEEKHGDLLTVLTPNEADIVAALEKTRTPMTTVHLAEETGLTEAVARRVVGDLVEVGILELRRQEKITATARGATNPEYKLSPKYQGRSR